MNIYKIYFNYIIKSLDKFKLESNYNFDKTEILKKITLEPPKNIINGDMSTNLAMLLSKSLKLNPKEIANKLKPYISNLPNVALVDIAGPGFINITLEQNTWSDCIKNILLNPQNWDKQDLGKGKKVNFFDIPSSTPSGAAILHKRMGSPIVFFTITKINNEYFVEFKKINASNALSVDQIVQEYTSALEAAIRQRPEQYFWFHKRWKTTFQ